MYISYELKIWKVVKFSVSHINCEMSLNVSKLLNNIFKL